MGRHSWSWAFALGLLAQGCSPLTELPRPPAVVRPDSSTPVAPVADGDVPNAATAPFEATSTPPAATVAEPVVEEARTEPAPEAPAQATLRELIADVLAPTKGKKKRRQERED